MPNWCSNELRITGPDEDRLVFMTRVRTSNDSGETNPLDFETLLPTPPALLARSPEGGDWYAWRVRNWGVKGSALVSECETASDHLLYRFDTAWNGPVPWIQAASRVFPRLRFALVSAEPGNQLFEAFFFLAGTAVAPTAAEQAWMETFLAFFRSADDDDGRASFIAEDIQ